jgi:glycine dehydrogenase subunit 1
MEVANASMYDGSTAATEAAMMAERVTGKAGCVVARSVHPEYREVLTTYATYQGTPITTIGFGDHGRVSLDELDKAITDQVGCVLIQSPNFFGTIEDVAAIADVAHKKGALLAVAISEAASLGIVRPPAEADIVAMEAQSFGVPLGFGGPYAGVIATKEKYVRQIPGRLVGETLDRNGKRGFVLTLSTREQHIRREKATSNICTNQALVALMVTIFMTVYGREGIRELAEQNLAKAAYAADAFKKAGAKILFEGAPRFNEFVIQTKSDPYKINDALLEQKIVGGFPVMKKFYPELGNASLWCVTEMNSREQIDAAAKEVSR